MTSLIIFLVILFACLAIGIPIFIGLGVGAVTILLFTTGEIPLSMIGQKMITGVDSFPLMAIPLFILAGELMNTKSVSGQLIDFTKSIVGRVRGGLAFVGVGTGMFFSSISGSSSAATAAVGSTLIPALKKEGYEKGFASALIASAGSIGPIIPPSIPLIIYGLAAQVSIGELFLAGYVPGIFMGLFFCAIIYYYARKEKYPIGSKIFFKEFLKITVKTIPAFLLPVIIMGGILLGIFTPTESAAVAAGYAFLLSVVIFRDIKLKDLPNVVSRAAVTSSIIMIVIASATLLSWVFTIEQIPQTLTQGLLSLTQSPIMILIIINLILLLLGMLLDAASAIIVLTPLFLPIVLSIGYDPVLFGVMMAVNLSIGVLTPPVGLNLFVAASIGETNILHVAKACLPFIAAIGVVLLLMIFIPGLFSYLPNLLLN